MVYFYDLYLILLLLKQAAYPDDHIRNEMKSHLLKVNIKLRSDLAKTKIHRLKSKSKSHSHGSSSSVISFGNNVSQMKSTTQFDFQNITTESNVNYDDDEDDDCGGNIIINNLLVHINFIILPL